MGALPMDLLLRLEALHQERVEARRCPEIRLGRWYEYRWLEDENDKGGIGSGQKRI